MTKIVCWRNRKNLIDPTFSTEFGRGRRKWRTLTIADSEQGRNPHNEADSDHGISDYAVAAKTWRPARLQTAKLSIWDS